MRIKQLVAEGRMDPIPIYIDSPLASRATEVFRRHPECYDEETTKPSHPLAISSPLVISIMSRRRKKASD